MSAYKCIFDRYGSLVGPAKDHGLVDTDLVIVIFLTFVSRVSLSLLMPSTVTLEHLRVTLSSGNMVHKRFSKIATSTECLGGNNALLSQA